ncbi:hypothetical protein J6590_069453 [Homalodisca vitripennis]|nr:hypothetical protein J6590_069453 [Homalodisca vitripennis]
MTFFCTSRTTALDEYVFKAETRSKKHFSIQYTTNESIITVTELTTTVPPESGSDTVTHFSRHRGHKDGIKQLTIVERFAWLGVLSAVLTALFKVHEYYLH